MRQRLWLTAVSVALAACARSAEKPGTDSRLPLMVADSVVLERSGCYGTCPAYRLRLSNAGEVRFDSRNTGDSSRVGIDTVAPGTLALLTSKADSAGFFLLPRTIAGDSILCRNRATDHPTVTVTFFSRMDSSQVSDYHGCFETFEHGVLPRISMLRAFEAQIDTVLRSSRWIQPSRFR